MNKLVEFLLARIDDDEIALKREAKAASRAATVAATNGSSALDIVGSSANARMRTDCKARRQMVGVLQRMLVLHDLPTERSQRESAGRILKLMALQYRDHPAYRDEWKV